MLTINKKVIKWYKIVPTFFLMPSMQKLMSVHRISKNVKIMSKSVKSTIVKSNPDEKLRASKPCAAPNVHSSISAKSRMPVLCNMIVHIGYAPWCR